jgi:hypothetical protein
MPSYAKFSSVVFAASPLWSNVTATKQRVKSETGTQKTFLFSEAIFRMESPGGSGTGHTRAFAYRCHLSIKIRCFGRHGFSATQLRIEIGPRGNER